MVLRHASLCFLGTQGHCSPSANAMPLPQQLRIHPSGHRSMQGSLSQVGSAE